MAGIDQKAEVIGRAVARGGREIRADLIPPGPGEGVLGEREKLDMGEPQPSYMVDQLRGDLAVGEWPPPFLRDSHPRSEMGFVDGHRRTLQLVWSRTARHPLAISPLIGGDH